MQVASCNNSTHWVFGRASLVAVWRHCIHFQKIQLAIFMTHNLIKVITDVERHVVQVRLEIATFGHTVHQKQSPTVSNDLLQSRP